MRSGAKECAFNEKVRNFFTINTRSQSHHIMAGIIGAGIKVALQKAIGAAAASAAKGIKKGPIMPKKSYSQQLVDSVKSGKNKVSDPRVAPFGAVATAVGGAVTSAVTGAIVDVVVLGVPNFVVHHEPGFTTPSGDRKRPSYPNRPSTPPPKRYKQTLLSGFTQKRSKTKSKAGWQDHRKNRPRRR